MRVQWLKEGDGNTSFFHKWPVVEEVSTQSNALKSMVTIWTIWVILGKKWKSIIKMSSLSNTKGGPRLVVFLFLIFDRDAAWLERPFSEEEVKTTVWKLTGDKTPGPDGFPIAFYKEC